MSERIPSSSEIICKALNMAPGGVPAEHGGVCALCGASINPGEFQAPLALGPAFMDDLSMAARGSQIICGWCVPCMSIEGLRLTRYGAFGADGFKPLRKWADITAAVTSPPDPPFVMAYATANNQHMAWRCPVNLSKELFYVRVGLRDVKIRRKFLLQAVDDCILLGEAVEALRGKKPDPGRKTVSHPFAALSSDLKSVEHGMIKQDVYRLAAGNAEMKAALDRVMSLPLGETWALRFLLTPGAGQNTEAV